VDVVQDKSGLAWQRLLALSKAGGFTRAGVLEVDHKVETELDLFVEQYLIPNIIKSIHISFKTLVEKFDYPPIPTLIELYASGELAEVLKLASNVGIGKAFENNASPTCQFGIASHFEEAMEVSPSDQAEQIVRKIQDGTFKKLLDKEGQKDYPTVKKLWKKINHEVLVNTQEWINQSFRNGGDLSKR